MSSILDVSMKKVLLSLPILLTVGLIPVQAEAAKLTWENSSEQILLGKKKNSPTHTFKGSDSFGNFLLSESDPDEKWEIILSVPNSRRATELIKGNIQIVGLTRKSKASLKGQTSKLVWARDNQLSVLVSDGKYKVKASNNLVGRKETFRFKAQSVPEPFSTAAAGLLAIAGVVRTLKRKRTEDA